jgi:hypothetical protein
MNLLGTICCLFAGRCAGEEPKRGEAAVPKGDLGQAEAELEKTSKEQLSHMEGGETGKTAQHQTSQSSIKKRLTKETARSKSL